MTLIQLPALSRRSSRAWHALFDLAERVPNNWCLVGGQMVMLWCVERGIVPGKPTDDGDAVLDVRAQPTILLDVTRALVDLGFGSAGESPAGHQHRWVRGDAELDLLIPENVGERVGKRKGITGGTTPEAPGATQALHRAELVEVVHENRTGRIWRPNLLGAMVMKAAAYAVPLDAGKQRHLTDFAILTTLIRRSDRLANQMDERDRSRLRNVIGALRVDGSIIPAISGSAVGVDRLLVALNASGDSEARE